MPETQKGGGGWILLVLIALIGLYAWFAYNHPPSGEIWEAVRKDPSAYL